MCTHILQHFKCFIVIPISTQSQNRGVARLSTTGGQEKNISSFFSSFSYYLLYFFLNFFSFSSSVRSSRAHLGRLWLHHWPRELDQVIWQFLRCSKFGTLFICWFQYLTCKGDRLEVWKSVTRSGPKWHFLSSRENKIDYIPFSFKH